MTSSSQSVFWDPDIYLKFSNERTRPAQDLINGIGALSPSTAIDLGCGPGTVTRMLAARWPQSRIIGVDSSSAMLAEANAHGGDIQWIEADAASWNPERPVDLIFSNAAMHWLADHQTLFRRLAGQLRTGGVLAVQMPRNFEAPSHLAMLDTVQAGPWRDRLAPLVRNSPVGAPDWYVDILSPITRWQNIWETVYWHVLEGDNPVVEWMKGTALRPLLQALNHDQQRAFQSEFARRIADAYPRRSCGRTVFPFRRLFIVAGR